MASASEKAVIRSWADLADEDGGEFDSDLELPPPVVVGPDEDGLTISTEYRIDDAGNKVKVTTTTRRLKLARARLSKAALERRDWAKFGDAASGDDANSRLTVICNEEIFVERPLTGSARGGAREVYVPPKREAAFYPPGRSWDTKRDAAFYPTGRSWNTAAALRVSNLPNDADDIDLKNLFGPFGSIDRVSVAVNPRNGRGRGFAIVRFIHKADAEKAMARVNGHPYGSLILRVGWANEP